MVASFDASDRSGFSLPRLGSGPSFRGTLAWKVALSAFAGLLVTIAVFQYRWINQIKDDMQDRARSSLETAVAHSGGAISITHSIPFAERFWPTPTWLRRMDGKITCRGIRRGATKSTTTILQRRFSRALHSSPTYTYGKPVPAQRQNYSCSTPPKIG